MKHILFASLVMAAFGAASCSDSAGALGDDGGDPLDVRGLDVTSSALNCTAIPAPSRAELPHVSSGGARGAAVKNALAALLAAEEPPVAEGQRTMAIERLDCGSPLTPTMRGHACSFSVSIDGRAPVPIVTPRPSELAERLFVALVETGADDCNQRGDFLKLSNVAIDIPSGSVEFDDGSNFALLPTQNVRASGPEGSEVVAAMEAAGINDCDPTRTVSLLCNKLSGSPTCSRDTFFLENVGGSELTPVCTAPRPDGPRVALGAPEALTLWNAIIDAAAVSGYVPDHGTIENVNLVNGDHFTWDGATVRFALRADNLTPPPNSRAASR